MKAEKWVYAKSFSGFPDKSNFKLEEEDLPDNIQDGEVLLEAVYWSVDPYMRIFSKNVGDVMMGEQIARVTMSNSSEFPVGTYVSCMVGWRTHTIISDISKLNKLPEMGNLPTSLALGVMGMPGMTAYFGLLDICRPKPGETVLVNAAAGAVGNVVGQIAKIKGCKVIASTSTDEKCRWLREELGFDKVFNYKTTTLEDALKDVPEGIDCFFDNVGGDFTYTAIQRMNKGGRISICGHITDYNAAEETKSIFPYKLILYKLLTVQGIQGWEHIKEWPEAQQQMLSWIQKGLIKYRETVTTGFRNMPDAFLGLFECANIGKAILLVKSARQVVTVRNDASTLVINGKDMQHVDIIHGTESEGISVLVNNEGRIECIDLDSRLETKYPKLDVATSIDATGKCVIPGLVDAHTHPVWAGDRVHEFAMKLAGATYMEVHAAGGGIHYTVEHTRKATEQELYLSFSERLYTMLSTGTTCVECKSGYGLNKETEVKMLSVIETGKREMPITISSTFCGAHAVPKGKTADEATDDVISVQLPVIKNLMKEGKLQVDNIDVFCEDGVFNIEQSRKILQAGKDAGLQINFHGDELHPLKGAEMGAELQALAISHLEEISDTGINAMVKAGSVGVVLPTTAYILRLKPPPVRKMIDSGMAVALGSDFNPNAYCMSMPMVMHLACVLLRMSMNEALIAGTLNAAAALGLSKDHGSISVGKYADMILLNAPRWEHLVYQFGCHDKIINSVIRHGDIVHTRDCCT